MVLCWTWIKENKWLSGSDLFEPYLMIPYLVLNFIGPTSKRRHPPKKPSTHANFRLDLDGDFRGLYKKKKSSGLSLKLGEVQPLGLSFSWQWNLLKSTAPKETLNGSKQGKSRESFAVPCDLKLLPFQTAGGPAALWPLQNTRSPPGTAQGCPS